MTDHCCETVNLLSRISSLENLIPNSPYGNDTNHLHFESTRRFLDIIRHIYRRWPNSTHYILALNNITLLTEIFEQFPFKANHSSNVADGAHSLFKQSTKQLNNPFFHELLEFEDAQTPHSITDYTYVTVKPESGHFILFPYDFESFYISLQFYGRASAPPFLYQQLNPEPGQTYKVYS